MNPMIRADAGFAKVAAFVNRCGYHVFNNAETGEPFSERDLQPWVDPPELTLEEAMKKWG